MIVSESRLLAHGAWLVILLLGWASPVAADTVTLRNGMVLEGDLGTTSRIGELAEDFSSGGGSIVIVDDGLRRIFVDKKQIANLSQEIIADDVIRVDQPVSSSVETIKGIGQPLYVGPFNALGRRVTILPGPEGPREFIQGISKINATYTVLETLTTKRFNTKWESRIATSSIPRTVLSSVIQRSIDPTNPNERLQIVQLFIEAERYKDAVEELELFLHDFPDLTDKKNLADSLRQAYARQIIREIEQRQEAGQHEQAYAMIRQFPTSGIAGEILTRVLELKQEHDQQVARIEEIRQRLTQLEQQCLQGDSLAPDQQPVLSEILTEIRTDVNFNNVGRLAAFYRFRDDASQTIDQKLAFAITGWLLGDADVTGNLQVALSLVAIRRLTLDYLRAALPHEREDLLPRFDAQEGASVANVAKLLAHLTPPILEPGTQLETEVPGMFEITVEDGSRPYHYLVQLPPEYDPYRRYPCIVTLNGDRTPAQQLAWWAGEVNPGLGRRVGQAGRHGYIVIAPTWRRDEQVIYEYTPQEHARVLDCLRDATRRFSVDTDKVFLSGHSIGGDAAWDIALAHPDLWAGMIGIAASAGKYVNHYHSNASGTLALYFVHGDYDHPRMAANKMDWNRYFRDANCDAMVVAYQGRGHENFQEEILRIFDWMELHQRPAAPKTLEVRTMRPWDRFFYWLELDQFPESTMVVPAAFPEKGKSAAFCEAQIYPDNNLINVPKCSAAAAVLWLNPDVINLDLPIEIRFKGDTYRDPIQPELRVLLEDARTRGDRQHPFWIRVPLGNARP